MADGPRLTLPQDGRLASAPLALLLGRLGVLRATGVLDLNRKKLARRFVLDGGMIVALVSNAREDRFFEWLVREGRLPALDEQNVADLAHNLGNHPLTAGALVALGVVPQADVGALLTEHTAALLREVAGWPDATFAIRPGRVPLDREPPAMLSALALGLELAREDAGRARRPPQLPRRVNAPLLPDEHGRTLLSELELAILDACSRGHSGAEPQGLAHALGRDVAAVQSALTALWCAGLLVDAAEGQDDEDADADITPESLDRWLAAAQAEDLEALLGVVRGADEAAVRKAYYRTVRRFHPDRFRSGPFAARYREVEQAFRLVHEAVRVLASPAARAEFEARRQATSDRGAAVRHQSALAADAFARGTDSLAKGKRADALQWIERAATSLPDEAIYQLKLGLLLAAMPARRNEGIQKLAQLAQSEAGRADVLAGYALALHHAGLGAQAQAALAALKQLEPRDPVALALGGDAAALRLVRQDPFLALFF